MTDRAPATRARPPGEFLGIAAARGGRFSDLLEAVVLTICADFLMADVAHPGRGRPLKQPGQHLVHGFVRSLQQDFDTPVGQIAHPAAQFQQMRLTHGRGPKTDALYPALDENRQSFQLM